MLASCSYTSVAVPVTNPLIENSRKDRYNPKLKKYYVVYEEGDEELSEDEERLDQMDTEVPYLH